MTFKGPFQPKPFGDCMIPVLGANAAVLQDMGEEVNSRLGQ